MAKIENSLGQNIISGNSIWGDITGNVEDQNDLINFLDLNFYPLNSNPESYLTLDTLPDVSFPDLINKPTTLSGYGITDAYPLLGNPGNFLTTETDPVFTGSPAGSISNIDKTNWNNAFGWGNHALVGYEPGFSKNTAFNKNFGTTINTVTEGNDSRVINGQTAFSWGNHASAGYLLSETDPIFNAWLNNNDNENKFVVKNKYIILPLVAAGSSQNLAGPNYSIIGASARTFSDTNLFTRTPSLGLVTTTSINNVALARQILTYFSLNCEFDLYLKFGSNENANLSGIRTFIGISTAVGVQSNVEPDTLTNSISISRLSTSNNWHLLYNDNAGIATSIDLGVNFPANTVATDIYLARFKTVGSNVQVTVIRLNTGDVFTHTITSDLPSSSTPLNLRWWTTNNSNASQVGLDFMGSYLSY